MTEPTPRVGLTPGQMRAAIASLSSPDVVDSPFGDLRFFDGVPAADTVSTIYDALDLMRGIDAFLNAVPGASLVAFRKRPAVGRRHPARPDRHHRTAGQLERALPHPEHRDHVRHLLPRPQGVGADGHRGAARTRSASSTTSGSGTSPTWASPGPTRAPAGSTCSCRPTTRARCPTATSPSGPRRSPTGSCSGRSAGCPRSSRPASTRCRRPAIRPRTSSSTSRRSRSTPCTPTTSRSTRRSTSCVQEEPVEALDPERAGQLAAIGIVKGQPFAPDDADARHPRAGRADRRRDRAAIAYAPRDPAGTIHGSWQNAFVGGSYEFLRDGARLLDARTLFHYLATVITPAMAHAQVGAGSAYAYTAEDANGDVLDGGRTYRLHVAPHPRRRTSGRSTCTTPRPAR